MKKLLCGAVAACLIATTLPVHASETATAATGAPTAAAPVGLRTSAQRAAQTAGGGTLTQSFPRPDRGPDRSRKQMGGGGGSKTGMIIGLVSAVAGVAGTIYMVKAMKDSNDRANDQ